MTFNKLSMYIIYINKWEVKIKMSLKKEIDGVTFLTRLSAFGKEIWLSHISL